MLLVLCGAGAVVTLAACGKKNDVKNSLTSGVLGDSASLAESTSSVVEDALESAGGGEAASGSSAALTPQMDLDSQFTKTCVAGSDGSAVVTVSSTLSDSSTLDKTKFSVLRVRSGSGEQKRTWLKAGITIPCKSDGKEAQISWADPTGLKLTIDVNRERSDKLTLTNKVTGKVKEQSRSFLATGSRSIEWLSASNTSTLLTRTKSVTSNVERKLTFTKSTGEETNLLLTVKTAANAPLNVTVERDAVSPYALKSKLINSGSIETTLPDGGKTVTTFSSLKFEVSSDGVCSTASGGSTVVISDSAGVQQDKVTCTADSGAFTCVNSSNETVDVTPPQCDAEDKQ